MNSDKSRPTLACPPRAELRAFAAGQLAVERLEAVAEHLDLCAACSAALVQVDAAVDPLVAELRLDLRDVPIPEAEKRHLVARVEAVATAHPEGGATLDPAAPAPPRQIGPYLLVKRLGEGGMGEVWQAIQVHLQKRVALKLIREQREVSPSTVARFRREMRAVGQLRHPHIVEAYDAEVDEVPYLAMELIEGTDLAGLLKRRGPLSVADACELTRQAALGLQHAHEAGLVHRDIKPSNLMLTAAGVVKVMDLGLARLREEAAGGEAATAVGTVMGTPNYMAPEQLLDSSRVDIRADIYSLGCTLYQMLAGTAPFDQQDSLTAKRRAHLMEPPPPIWERRPEVPRELTLVLERMLAKEPARRPQTPLEVAGALEPFCRGHELTRLTGGTMPALAPETQSKEPPTRRDGPLPRSQGRPRPRRWLVAGAALVLIGAAGVLIVTRTFVGQPTKIVPTDIVTRTFVGQPTEIVPTGSDFDEWLKAVGDMKGEQQLQSVVERLQALNPGFNGHVTRKHIHNGVVTAFGVPTDNITNLAPLRAFSGLTNLECCGSDWDKGKLRDLSPLRGMKLTNLSLRYNDHLTDLSPLKEMPLTYLNLTGDGALTDLRPLQGMPLTSLDLFGCGGIRDISALRGMALTSISCHHTSIADLSPLQGMAIARLDLCYTQVADLTPLKSMKLTFLSVQGTKVTTLEPLGGMLLLTDLNVQNTPVVSLEPLRGMKLTGLACDYSRINDLSPLKGMPLTGLRFPHTLVSA